MIKSYTLRYRENFEHHIPEDNEEEFQTEEELREALANLCYSNGISNVQVSYNVDFEDFYIEAYECGLDE